jgi:flagellar basal-body rod modification protein FlgD
MSITSVNSTSSAQSTANAVASAASSGSTPAATQANFLKLLVAQLNSQDPMNPMDNAQMTTQMAQLNMVSGIDTLNTTVQSMATQFSSMQALQGASIVGHDVIVNGSNLALNAGVGKGAINLASNADAVSVNVVTASGQVLDTIKLGPQSAGQVPFSWTTSTYANRTDLSFNVTATAAGQAVVATPLMQATVVSANPSATGLSLGLLGQSSPVAYRDVVSIL